MNWSVLCFPNVFTLPLSLQPILQTKAFHLGSQWPANPNTGFVIKKSFIRLFISLNGIWLPSPPPPPTVVLQQRAGKEVKGHPMQSAGQDFKEPWGKLRCEIPSIIQSKQ